MPKVVLIQQVYKSRRFMEKVYPAMAQQTFKDIKIISQIVDDDGGCKEYIQEHFPQIEILEPGYNIGFSKGHNEIFVKEDAEFFQLVNPDLILEPNYVEEMLKAFEDSKVGAATGKLLRYNFEKYETTNIIDTTGVVITRAGNAKDRGQNQKDEGQFDGQLNLIAVSGAGPMYRRAALESVKYKGQYFDEDFHSYYEDVDLGWRMVNFGWKCRYVPTAVGHHGRMVGSSPGGYKKFISFVKHRNKVSLWVKQLSLKNHIFLYVKNSPKFYFKFFVRELFLLAYTLVFEIKTFKILPTFFAQFPKMLLKRKYIQNHRRISVVETENLFL